ncbi:MAG: arginase [Chlorobi bacterium CHB2]|nr:arginase [Chlorobi bacterium CHB2]
MLDHLIPTDPALFFTKNDPTDPRMGDLVGRGDDAIAQHTRVAIIGVPQELGVARNGGRVGAAQAPDAIRAMFYRLTPFDLATGRSIPHGAVVDLGNIRCDGELDDELEEIHDRLAAVVAAVCRRGLIPLVLGGGHDVTYAAASGVHALHGRLGVLNFDAHLDVRPPNPLRNSGTSFRMLIEEGKLAPEQFVEFGIQSFANAESHVEWVRGSGGTIIPLEAIRQQGFPDALLAAYRIASSEGRKSVYGTLDMDGVRAADAPGVSATMPDGFAAAEFLSTARLLGRSSTTVAMDIVEVNPRFDRDNQTTKLAAHAMMRFIGGIGER